MGTVPIPDPIPMPIPIPIASTGYDMLLVCLLAFPFDGRCCDLWFLGGFNVHPRRFGGHGDKIHTSHRLGGGDKALTKTVSPFSKTLDIQAYSLVKVWFLIRR